MEMIGKRMIEAAQQAVPSVPAKEVYSRLPTREVFILDVREPDEWEEGHIEGATLLSRGRIEGRIEEMIPDKNTSIVTH